MLKEIIFTNKIPECTGFTYLFGAACPVILHHYISYIHYIVCNEIRYDICDSIEGRWRKRSWPIQIRYKEPLLEGMSINTKICPVEIRSRYSQYKNQMVHNCRHTLLSCSKISLSNKQATDSIVRPIYRSSLNLC
jgi:hypothetical protein